MTEQRLLTAQDEGPFDGSEQIIPEGHEVHAEAPPNEYYNLKKIDI